MSAAGKILNAVWILSLVLVLSTLAFGSLTRQPILFSYPITDSMLPTLRVGDLFFIAPRFLVNIETGDIIVYHSPQRGYLVHRVVAMSPAGLTTRGDNSPFSDQDGGEPPVQMAQISGEVVTLQGRPLVIPHAGAALNWVQNVLRRNQLAVIAAMVLLGTASILDEQRNAKRRRALTRRAVRARQILLPALAIFFVLALAAMILQHETVQFDYWILRQAVDNNSIVYPQRVFGRVLELENRGWLPQYVLIDAPAANPDSVFRWMLLASGETRQIELNFTAPRATGNYTADIHIYRYAPLLPAAVMVALFKVHPFLPLPVIALVILLPCLLLYRLLGPDEVIAYQRK